MISHTLYSSNSDEWETPQSVFDELDAVYHFDLDACATEQNAKCRRFFDKAQDGLKQSWGGCNGMVQSSVFQGGRLGAESGGRTAERDDHGHADICPNRYEMVPRIHIPKAERGNHIRERPVEIQRRKV